LTTPKSDSAPRRRNSWPGRVLPRRRACDRGTKPGETGNSMPDQADGLRRLVRAQRQWVELTPRNRRAAVSRPLLQDPSTPARDDNVQLRTRGAGIGVFMARAARWAFARAGVSANH
jgi:hypothetical protein